MTEEGIRAIKHLCPKCGGKGYILTCFSKTQGVIPQKTECDICHGTGKEEFTNEEYIRTCTTEELAELIVNLTLLDKWHLYDRFEAAEYERGIDVGGKQEAMKWLKEKHTNV